MTNDNAKNLLPCPFCGKTETLKVTSASEFWDDTEDAPYMHSESYGVFCDASKPGGLGGCGASSGFKETVQQAIETWNTRENKQSRTHTNALELPELPPRGATILDTPMWDAEQMRAYATQAIAQLKGKQ